MDTNARMKNTRTSPFVISAYELATYRSLGTLKVTGTPGSLIRSGTSGLAFRTHGNQIFLIESSLVQ